MAKLINQDILKNIEIRGHHLLCLLGFRGLGYSQDFIKNMAYIAKNIFAPNNFIVTLTAKEDAICNKCPHNKNHHCFKNGNINQDIENRDMQVLKKIKLAAGANILTKELWRSVKENIRPQDLRTICRGCKWFKDNHCIEGLKRLRKNLIYKEEGPN